MMSVPAPFVNRLPFAAEAQAYPASVTSCCNVHSVSYASAISASMARRIGTERVGQALRMRAKSASASRFALPPVMDNLGSICANPVQTVPVCWRKTLESLAFSTGASALPTWLSWVRAPSPALVSRPTTGLKSLLSQGLEAGWLFPVGPFPARKQPQPTARPVKRFCKRSVSDSGCGELASQFPAAVRWSGRQGLARAPHLSGRQYPGRS